MGRYLPHNSLIIEREICVGVSVGLGNTPVEIREGVHRHCTCQVLRYRNVYFGLSKITETWDALSYEFVDAADPQCRVCLDFTKKANICPGTSPVAMCFSYINRDGTKDKQFEGDFLGFIPIQSNTPELDRLFSWAQLDKIRT